VSYGRLNGRLVQRIPNHKFCAPCYQFFHASGVASEERDVVSVIKEHRGKETGDVTASTDQKK
jgi:protein-arginine kinase activator protein McsA